LGESTSGAAANRSARHRTCFRRCLANHRAGAAPCSGGQEFVIGGYIPGSHGFDALLVGVYENKRLIFVAKDGFVPRIRDEIFPVLQRLRTAHCPFKNLPEEKVSRWGESLTAEKMKECYWVKPKLVCQVAFVEWTDAWHLRHCTFVAMRDDKKPAEVVRET
jgi:ATP-dependent DNA ligase